MKRIFILAMILALGLGAARFVSAQAGAPAAPTSPQPQGAASLSTRGEYNVRLFGARRDGQALDSPAINSAIAAASAAGGGTVLLPAGTYLSLSIRLQSNIRLHLDQGAVLLAAPRTQTQRYDAAEKNPSTRFQDFGHSHWHNSLVWGEGLQNVTIDGAGEIYGKGLERDDQDKRDGEGDKAIALENIQLHTLEPDARPLFALDDVEGAEFFRVKAPRVEGAPAFAIKNSSGLTVRMVDGTEDKQQKTRFEGTF